MPEQMISKTVRLSPHHMRVLEARARARGMQLAPYLRSLVVDVLERADGEDATQAIEKLVCAIDDLRHRLAKATTGILKDLQTIPKKKKTDELSLDEIERWVGRNILG